VGLIEFVQHRCLRGVTHAARAELVYAFTGGTISNALRSLRIRRRGTAPRDVHGIFRHFVFVVGVALRDMKRRNAPGVLHAGIDADMMLEAGQHCAHRRHVETGAAHVRQFFEQRIAVQRKVPGRRRAAAAEIVGVSTYEFFSRVSRLRKRGM